MNARRPSAQTSVAGVTVPGCVCSGAIQGGVPTAPVPSRGLGDDLRDAEVEHLHENGAPSRLRRREEHVLGLEVAVDDAALRARRASGVTELRESSRDRARRQRDPAREA